jgi:transposase
MSTTNELRDRILNKKARGLTTVSIARELGVSRQTVYYHLRPQKRKRPRKPQASRKGRPRLNARQRLALRRQLMRSPRELKWPVGMTRPVHWHPLAFRKLLRFRYPDCFEVTASYRTLRLYLESMGMTQQEIGFKLAKKWLMSDDEQLSGEG